MVCIGIRFASAEKIIDNGKELRYDGQEHRWLSDQQGKAGVNIMWTMSDLLQNFFTHKDFLPPADQVAGTLFTPLHLLFSLLCALLLAVACWAVYRRPEKTLRRVYGLLWAVVVVLEVAKIVWESCAGNTVGVE